MPEILDPRTRAALCLPNKLHNGPVVAPRGDHVRRGPRRGRRRPVARRRRQRDGEHGRDKASVAVIRVKS